MIWIKSDLHLLYSDFVALHFSKDGAPFAVLDPSTNAKLRAHVSAVLGEVYTWNVGIANIKNYCQIKTSRILLFKNNLIKILRA